MNHYIFFITTNELVHFEQALTRCHSMLANMPPKTTLHILCAEKLKSEQRLTLQQGCESRRIVASFCDQASITHPLHTQLPQEILLFLALLDTFSIGKVLFSDRQTIINTALQKFFDFADNKHLLGGHNYNTPSGLFVMDISFLHAYADQIKNTIAENFAKLQNASAPLHACINLLASTFQMRSSLLPEKYDYAINASLSRYLDTPAMLQDKVIHYNAVPPWEQIYPAALTYWEYHSMAYPAVNVFEKMEELPALQLVTNLRNIDRTPGMERKFRRYYERKTHGTLYFILRKLGLVKKRKQF